MNPFLVKNVMRTYDQHQQAGRRIARFKKYMDRAGQEDSVSISKEAKRRQLVEKVAGEIVNNLIGSDTTNPVVREIKTQMAKEFGQDVLFRYPSDGSGLQILKKTDQGVAELTNGEKDAFMRRLWEIALTRVNETML
ncbi:MAG: DVU0524 family FlgM-associated protein [Desulfomicrobium apsheronum]|nr:DVU0524 family FlgM-associated protein [Desulfomicrobium apsheronum]